jgi:5-(carboxyamino)imidazole ribonucleotide synthase
VFLPGATLGVLGGGQLARMAALEARRMGYRVAVLDPDPHGPASQVADVVIEGAFDDEAAAMRLAACADVVTLDTEHIPAALLRRVDTVAPVRPSPQILDVVQDRWTQREFLRRIGAPQPALAPVHDPESLAAAAASVPFPGVLKTRRSGYDPDSLAAAWEQLGRMPCVLEAFVQFEREISVVLARGVDGTSVVYPCAENDHRNHILHITRVPARIPATVAAEAEALGRRVAAALEHVGVLALELFVTRDGALLVNEIAPRTHNSGHFTFGASLTSQFEQHVRAVCGLALGSTSTHAPVVMLNLLGDLWVAGEPDWSVVLADGAAQLHLYGKRDARRGRKMGHVLFFGDDAAERAERVFDVLAARSAA